MQILRTLPVADAVFLFGHASGTLADLHSDERALLSPRATKKRCDDFVAGRLFAKEALRRACGDGEWIIDRAHGDKEGAPIVKGPRAAHVSISHVDGFVCAVASRTQVSVDLVKLEVLSDAFCDEAFTAQERRAWHATDHTHAMAIAFAAKEAALKWLETGMGTPLHDVQVLPRRLNAIDLCTRAQSITLACATLTHEAWLGLVLYPGSNP